VNFSKLKKDYRGRVGYGINPEVNNKYVHLGRYILNYHSLYYKNYFKLYNKNHQSIAGLQGVNVSDTFVHIIQKLINNQHVSKENLEMLSPNEHHYFNTIIHICGLKSQANSSQIITQLKHRLKNLEGELQTGNDNPLIIKEVTEILRKLKEYKIITAKKMNSYLEQMSFISKFTK